MNPFLLLLIILGLSKSNQAKLRQENESAFTICLTPEGNLTRGSQAQGDSPYHVSLPISCPSNCKTVGIWHRHPGGDTEPSHADIAEALRLRIKHLCITSDSETKCHEIGR
jgi:proteasome lid subunit RPN8/RPN11